MSIPASLTSYLTLSQLFNISLPVSSSVKGEIVLTLKGCCVALAGVTQWIEHRPVNQRVAGSTPSQGTGLGCGAGSPVGGA